MFFSETRCSSSSSIEVTFIHVALKNKQPMGCEAQLAAPLYKNFLL